MTGLSDSFKLFLNYRGQSKLEKSFDDIEG